MYWSHFAHARRARTGVSPLRGRLRYAAHIAFLDDHLGPYIGPTAREDVLEGLAQHEYHTVAVEIDAPDGSTILHAEGTLYAFEDAPPDFLVGGREEIGDDGPRVRDYKIALTIPDGCAAARHMDGFCLALPGGVSLTIVLWQGVLHVTEGGDVAPRVGPYQASIEDADEGPGPTQRD